MRAGGVAFDESVVGRGGAGYLWPPPRRDGGFVPRHSLAPPLRPGAKPEAVLEEEAASPAAAEDAGDAFAHDPEARRASRADVQRAPPARRVLGEPAAAQPRAPAPRRVRARRAGGVQARGGGDVPALRQHGLRPGAPAPARTWPGAPARRLQRRS